MGVGTEPLRAVNLDSLEMRDPETLKLHDLFSSFVRISNVKPADDNNDDDDDFSKRKTHP